MQTNVGSTDRLLRIILGVVLLVLPFVLGWVGAAKIISIIAGVVMLFTGLSRFCALYTLLGMNTAKTDKS